MSNGTPTERGKFTKGSGATGEMRSELYYAMEDLLAMGVDIHATSLYRDRGNVSPKYKPGSPHGHGSACDISHNRNPALMTFLFGKQYDPNNFKADSMKDWVLTEKAEKWAKKHNILILDEYEIGLGHLHFEVQTRDGNSEAGKNQTEIVSEHGEDFSSRKNFTNGKGKYLDAHYWGTDSKTFVENDYNTSEFYTENVATKEYEKEDKDRLKHPTNIISIDELNETNGGERGIAYNESNIEIEKGKEEITVDERSAYNMPPTEINPTPEMLEAAPEYNSAEEVLRDWDNGTLKSGDIINVNGEYHQVDDFDGTGNITSYRESDNTFNAGEGGTLDIEQWVDLKKQQEEEVIVAEEEEEVIVAEEEEEVIVAEEVPEEEVIVAEEIDLPSLTYKAQLGIWRGENLSTENQEILNNLRKEGYTIVKEHLRGELYKYSAYKTDEGPPTTKAEADFLQAQLIKFGASEDAFVYAEKDGVRITDEEATELETAIKEKETSVRVSAISDIGKPNYEVQVGIFSENINEETQALLDKIEESGEYVVKKEHDKGILYKYTVERKDGTPINSNKDAEVIRQAMIEAGFKDTFVVAYDNNGNRVKVEDAISSEAEYNTKNPDDKIVVRSEEKEEVEEIKSFADLSEVPAELEDEEIIVDGETYIKDDNDKWIVKPFEDLEDTEEIVEEHPKTTEVLVYNPNTELTEIITVPIDEDGVVTEYPENVEYDEDYDRYVFKTPPEKEIQYPEKEKDFSIHDDEETIREKILYNNPDLANDPDKLEELFIERTEEIEWLRGEVEGLKEDQKYIDQIFAENPELAAKYEGVALEDYEDVEGWWDDDGLRNQIINAKEIGEENEKQVNKEETGIFETDSERLERETLIAEYDDLKSKELNNTITADEFDRLEEITTEYGDEGPIVEYEDKKILQAERDANILAGKGDLTDLEVEQEELQKGVLEKEREENFEKYGVRETDEEASGRMEKEMEANYEKYTKPKLEKLRKQLLNDEIEQEEYDERKDEILKIGEEQHRITDVQAEEFFGKREWSTPDSEKELRNDLKKKLDNQENALRAAVGNEEELEKINKEIETTKLALEYLELKNKYGEEEDVFDINKFKEAVENNDIQQLNMFYNDQRKETIDKLEKDRQAIQDGTFEGSKKEREEILTTLETLNIAKEKSELPEFESETDRLLYITNLPAQVDNPEYISEEETPTVSKKIENPEITKLKNLQKDKDYFAQKNEPNLKMINAAIADKENSLITAEDYSAETGYTQVINWENGSTYYISTDWLNKGESKRAKELQKLENKGSISSEEQAELNALRKNDFHSRDVFSKTEAFLATKAHPEGSQAKYDKGIQDIDKYIANRKQKILATGANPDVNLTARQLEIFDEINAPDYDNAKLEADLNEIVNISPELFKYDLTLEAEDEELRSMGPTGQEILQGVTDTAQGILSAFGGPDALINAVMGKEALAAAMQDISPGEKAKLSPAFNEHLRQTKELTKRGLHPSEEAKIRKGIDTAYQIGLENTIRGTSGDRAKYLASSGILDAKRSLALLEVSAQDAELQRQNQAKYSELLMYKENFDAAQKESLRTENLQMALANKKAASEFAGLAFADAMGRMGSSSSEIDRLRQSLMNGFFQGTGNPYKVSNKYDIEPTPTDE
jgi:hypothetical protein